MDFSSDIFIDASVVLISLHVVALNQTFNSLLDLKRIRWELDLQDFGALCYQTVVVNRLATLHHLHDRCIDDVLSIVFYLGTQLGLFCGLLSLRMHHWYLDLN